MNVADRLRRFLGPKPEAGYPPAVQFNMRELSEFPGFAAQLAAIRSTAAAARPWRAASIAEALGVPAVFRAASLIANTTGVLSLEAFRDGSKLGAADTPVVVKRPDPFHTPRKFFRDTAWNLATRGEAWWWVAARDFDNYALSVLCIPPFEVSVEEDPNDLRYPRISWRGRVMPNADMRQLTLQQEPGSLRGIGPLQVCGAAVSVAVEAQAWAANFFSGSVPSVTLESELELSESEADALAVKWASKPSNLPRVLSPSLHAKEFTVSPESAQLTESRAFENAEVARMYGIPGTLLDAALSGSSLTYQNVGQEFDSFVRQCLWPNYLEEIEQQMSDLLPRATVTQFNVDALLRADIGTRFEVYSKGIPVGVILPEEARAAEGLAPGGVETRPVPVSPPQAIPPASAFAERSLPDSEVRCDGKRRITASGVVRIVKCNHLLARGAVAGEIKCPRCGSVRRFSAA